jgi:chlorite dismutase
VSGTPTTTQAASSAKPSTAQPSTAKASTAEPKPSVRRQFVSFYGIKVDPRWRGLAADEKTRGKREFVAACESFRAEGGILTPYSLVGVRGDVDLLLWRIHYELEPLQRHAAALNKCALGPWNTTPYALLGMTKRSLYMDPIHPEHDEDRLHVYPGRAKYIFVYPFVKTRAWYALDQKARQEMMSEHIRIGTTYPSVKLNTTYSYGLDDQEFVVAFETDRPDDFLDLVEELRFSKASSYTLRDTPTFSAIRGELPEILDQLG